MRPQGGASINFQGSMSQLPALNMKRLIIKLTNKYILFLNLERLETNQNYLREAWLFKNHWSIDYKKEW